MPLTPKAETPARRGRSPAGQGSASASSSIVPGDQSICEEGVSACSVLGRTPACIAITTLITPATPAAAAAWPMLDLTEPSFSGRSRSCP